MRAGELRHRVTIQSKSVTFNDLGEEVITWSTVATVWAAVVPVFGTEAVDNSAREATATHQVRIRRRTDVTPVMRVVYGNAPDAVWYLPTDVAPEHCIAAYQAHKAATYAASKVNLAKPGTFDLSEDIVDNSGDADTNPPTWDAIGGWTFTQPAESGEEGWYPQALDTGIKLTDIGKGTGSVVVIYSDHTVVVAEQDLVHGVAYVYNLAGNPAGSVGAYLEFYTSTAHVSGGAGMGANNGAFQMDKFAMQSSGIVAMAGQAYFDGSTLTAFDTYATGTTAPYPPELDDYDLPSIYIGAGHVVTHDALGVAPSVPYSAGGFVGKIQAVAFYDVTLTAAQLGEIVTRWEALSAGGVNTGKVFDIQHVADDNKPGLMVLNCKEIV